MNSFKTYFSIVIALIITGSIFSCESVSNPESINTIDSSKTAIISGTAYANLDETNDSTYNTKKDYERAPQGTSVKVVLDSRDFASSVRYGVDYSSLTFTTTVDASGEFSIEVPALDDAITAKVYFNGFNARQVQYYGSSEVKKFRPYRFPYRVSIVSGLTSYRDAIYYSN